MRQKEIENTQLEEKKSIVKFHVGAKARAEVDKDMSRGVICNGVEERGSRAKTLPI